MNLLRMWTVAILMTMPSVLPAEDAVSPGMRIRVRIGEVVELPELVRAAEPGFGGLAVQSASPRIRQGSHTVTVDDATGAPVTVPQPGTRFEGEVVAVDGETILLSLDGQTVRITIPRSAVEEMAINRRRSKKSTGALIGLLVGGALGYALAPATPSGCEEPRSQYSGLFFCDLHESMRAFSVGSGLLAGAALGAIVASGAKWQPVAAGKPQLRLAAPRGRRGVGFSVSIGF